ncbi:MAG: sulfatase-like hydrolase/transferase, partial [Planctomycetaceae bacterium]
MTSKMQRTVRSPFAAVLYLTVVCSVAGAERPNMLIIVADDMGWADVGYHGSPIPTPHIDRLCRTGVELDQHYVAPVCTPTRVALLTGRYWSRFGNTIPSNTQVLPFGTETLASALKTVGYDTCITGKW